MDSNNIDSSNGGRKNISNSNRVLVSLSRLLSWQNHVINLYCLGLCHRNFFHQLVRQ